MSLTARQLNRATLDRQLLLRREPLNVADAVRRIVAVQAQEAASPYIALWNRITAFDPADLDAAFADRAVVKASLMRITLHAVHAEDYPKFHNAMWRTLRAARLGDSRFTSSGLSVADADALLPHLAEFTVRPRTVTEVEGLLAARLGERKRGAWWALRTFAPLHHAPTGGPWSFTRPSSFVAAPAKPDPDGEDESARWLALRYLQGFGPASVRDFAQFTMLRRPVAAQALKALGGGVEELEGPDGEVLFDVAGASIPAGDAVAPPRLLPMWDSTLLAYSDRSRVVPPDYRPLITRRNGDVLPTLLVDGYVAGVWRPVEEASRRRPSTGWTRRRGRDSRPRRARW
nr:winged helix DNA-binding domain-containing protein [Planobispora longispora]